MILKVCHIKICRHYSINTFITKTLTHSLHLDAVAAQVMSKRHKLKRALLQLQFARQEKGKVENFKRNQLSVHGLPEGVTKDFYEVVIGGCLNMDEEDDFELEVSDSSAIITFTEDYSTEGMYIIMYVYG